MSANRQLKDIKDYISEEYHNLNRDINRPRTRAAIANKKKLLNEALEEFAHILNEFENSTLPVEQWNRLTDQYTNLQSKVCLAFKILNNSAIALEPTDNRRFSESCLELEASNFTEEKLKDLERSLVFNELPFSSTLIEPQGTEGEKEKEEEPKFSESPKQLKEQLDAEDTSSFENHLKNLKKVFFRSSFIIQQKLDISKMANFQVDKAMQVIPEYRGVTAELEGFLYAIDYFASKIPPNDDHTELIQVVMLKLKGPAAIHFKRIKGETWPEVRTCLEKQFGKNMKLEELMQQIETLEQGQGETFQSYKDRALTLKESIDEYEDKKANASVVDEEEDEKKESYALRSLRLHFLGGLKNRNLRELAKTQKNKTFEEMTDYLGDECIDVEQIEQIEKRLRDMHLAESKRQALQGQNHFHQSNRNYRNNNNTGKFNQGQNQGFRGGQSYNYPQQRNEQRNFYNNRIDYDQQRNYREQNGRGNSFRRNYYEDNTRRYEEPNSYRGFNNNRNDLYRNNFRGNYDANRNQHHEYGNNSQQQLTHNPNTSQTYMHGRYERRQEREHDHRNWNDRFHSNQEQKN